MDCVAESIEGIMENLLFAFPQHGWGKKEGIMAMLPLVLFMVFVPFPE